MKLDRKFKIKFASVAISVLLSVYALEAGMAARNWLAVRKQARQFGATESRTQAATRLGVRTSANGRWFREFGIAPPDHWPIGTWPSTNVIGFLEGDGRGWPIHFTDQFGFFNESAWWTDKPTVLLVGDSFVTAEHLTQDSLTLELRKRGLRTVNVGLTGCGPLMELAAIKSAWARVSNSVQVVIWIFYCGNDFADAVEENEVAAYREALNPAAEFTPDQSLLALLPSNGSDNNFGIGYAVRSVATLKRVRLVWRRVTGRDQAMQIWNAAIAEAERFAPRVLLVRVNQPGANHDKQFAKIKAREIYQFPMQPSLYSRGWTLAHLTPAGYSALADEISRRAQ